MVHSGEPLGSTCRSVILTSCAELQTSLSIIINDISNSVDYFPLRNDFSAEMILAKK